jgi:hypothetical protein
MTTTTPTRRNTVGQKWLGESKWNFSSFQFVAKSAETSDEMDRDGSSSPRHSDKSQSHTTVAAATAAQAAACASSASAQAAHQAAQQAASAQAAFNYSAFLNASVSGGGGESVMLGSTENLLRNIQGLLKVAAENARQQDRQANYEKGNNFKKE